MCVFFQRRQTRYPQCIRSGKFREPSAELKMLSAGLRLENYRHPPDVLQTTLLRSRRIMLRGRVRKFPEDRRAPERISSFQGNEVAFRAKETSIQRQKNVLTLIMTIIFVKLITLN